MQRSRTEGRLPAVDVTRFLTVVEVILVHATSLANAETSVAANAVLQLAHITRSVFLTLSSFVLTYNFDRRPVDCRAFWRRRCPLVAVPYVAWSAVYVLTGGDLRSALRVLGRFLVDLLDGGAHFHLYFLLLTMQLYLVFPAMMSIFRRWPRSLLAVLAGSLVFQLAFTAAAEYRWRPPLLGAWFAHPGSWLASYTFYVVGGIAAARYFETVTGWILSHHRVVAGMFAGSVTLALVAYLLGISVLGYTPVESSAVFQPTNVVLATTAIAAELALGLWYVERAPARRLARLERSSDASFGIFLAHPLLLAAVLALAAKTGISAAIGSFPTGIVELFIAFGLVPFVYTLSFVLIASLRRTRASLAFCGRPNPAPCRR